MWMSLGVSPNGRHVAAGDHSMLHVWSVATGEELLATPQDGLDAGREPMQRAVGIAFDDRARLLLTVHQSQRPLAVWRLPR